MKSNRSLQKLHLGESSIGDAGATELAVALKSNQSLLELHLYGNHLIGVRALPRWPRP